MSNIQFNFNGKAYDPSFQYQGQDKVMISVAGSGVTNLQRLWQDASWFVTENKKLVYNAVNVKMVWKSLIKIINIAGKFKNVEDFANSDSKIFSSLLWFAKSMLDPAEANLADKNGNCDEDKVQEFIKEYSARLHNHYNMFMQEISKNQEEVIFGIQEPTVSKEERVQKTGEVSSKTEQPTENLEKPNDQTFQWPDRSKFPGRITKSKEWLEAKRGRLSGSSAAKFLEKPTSLQQVWKEINKPAGSGVTAGPALVGSLLEENAVDYVNHINPDLKYFAWDDHVIVNKAFDGVLSLSPDALDVPQPEGVMSYAEDCKAENALEIKCYGTKNYEIHKQSREAWGHEEWQISVYFATLTTLKRVSIAIFNQDADDIGESMMYHVYLREDLKEKIARVEALSKQLQVLKKSMV